jgi:hypothetical protein
MLNLKKKLIIFLINVLIFFILIFFLEIYLKIFGKKYQINKYYPVYISSYYRKLDVKIDQTGFFDIRNFRTAKKTISGDLVEDLYNYKGCKVVIIGDSVVYGDGVYAEDTYHHKLQEKIKCKIFAFSQNGWTSLEYFDFHDKFLKNSNYDYLIVNLNSNDLHLRGKYYSYNYDHDPIKHYYLDNIFDFYYPARVFYQRVKSNSEVVYIIDGIINKILERLNKKIFGYDNWLERLYEKENYLEWLNLVRSFNLKNKNKNIIYFFSYIGSSDIKRYDKIADSFRNSNVNFLYCRDQFLKLEPLTRADWANLADPHPGQRHRSVYTKCLYKFVKNVRLY